MRKMLKLWIIAITIVGAATFSITQAQETFPAQDQEKKSGEKTGEPKAGEDEGHKRTWEIPEIVVYGSKVLKEEQLIGPNEQPRWTARRRFPTTRVYVIPTGKFEFEWWAKYNVPRNGNKEVLYLYEFEMGLPYRLQLDLYQGYSDIGSSYKASQQSVELRWAMAKWGQLWGNPTWYLEYTTRDNASDKEEIKLLLGDELLPSWHWGVNLVREWSLNKDSEREEENGLTAGISYAVKDSVFSSGLELKTARETAFTDTGEKKWITTFKIGPSFLWRPTPSANIQLVPLFGIGKDSERSQTWLVIGWEL